MCPKKSEPLNILQQQLQICSNLNKILHTQDDICYKHYYIVSYKSALTLLISRVSQLTIAQPSHWHGGLGSVLLEGEEVTRD